MGPYIYFIVVEAALSELQPEPLLSNPAKLYLTKDHSLPAGE